MDGSEKETKIKSLWRAATCTAVLLAALFPNPAGFKAAEQPSEKPGVVLGAYTSVPEISAPAARSVEIVPQGGSTVTLKTTAREVLVYDLASGQLLVSQNADQQVPIASLTKLMTALVVYQSPNFDVPITVAKQDQVDVEPTLHLKVGDRVMPEQLVEAMLLGSANDAANTLANHFPNQATFLGEMNATAAALGMDSTHYTTPIGFDIAGNYSTASDLAKLVNAALKVLPYDQVWQKQSYSFTSLNGNAYSVENSNALVRANPNIFSIKTGQTPDALGNMIVEAKGSAGQSIISIVLGSTDRDADTLAAVDYTFKVFTWQQV